MVMKPLWVMLTSVLSLAPPEVKADDSPLGGYADVRRYAAMDSAAQQQWLRDLLTRLDRANRVVLGPEEVVRQRARYVVLWRRIVQGRAISPAELIELLRKTDEREEVAIDRLARQFRVQVYRTFRQRRGLFTRRRAAWNRVLAVWQAAGGRFEEQHRLIDWLESAIHRSLPHSIGPLPADPLFDAAPKTVEAILPTTSRPVQNRHVAELSEPRQPSGEAGDPPWLGALPSASIRPRMIGDGRPVPVYPSADAPLPIATRPPAEFSSITAGPSPAMGPSRESSANDSPAAATVVRRQRPSRGFSETPRQPSSPEPLPRMQDPFAEPAVARPVAARDAADTGNRTKQLPSRNTKALTASLSKQDDAVPPPSSVRVNVNELAARIAGTNLALRALEEELARERIWDARRLGPLIDQLGSLVIRNHDLAMFRELISGRQRAQVGRLESPRPAISQLAARIFEARARLGAPGSPDTQTQRQAELRHLDALSRELAALASKE